VSVGGRVSEALVLPAIVGLWWGHRGQVRLTPGRLIGAAALAVLPFAFAVCFYLVRESPDHLHARDDALRDALVQPKPGAAEPSRGQRLADAVSYSLGLKALGAEDFTKFSLRRLGWDLNKYAWHLSGLGALGDRFPEDAEGEGVVVYPAREQGRGTGFSVVGVAIAVFGFWRWRRMAGVVLLGVGLFAGNLVYYVIMHPVDNLHFTIPGQAGLAVGLALGLARLPAGEPKARVVPRWFRGYQVASLLIPLILLITNYRVVDPRTDEVREHQRLAELVARTALPERAVILATYSRSNTLRYVYWIAADRRDVRVVVFGEWFGGEDARRLLPRLEARGYRILIGTDAIRKDSMRHQWAQWTPRELIDVGLFCAPVRRPGLPRRPAPGAP
jgi:hypothetical protein